MRILSFLLAMFALGIANSTSAQTSPTAPDVFVSIRQAADGGVLQGVSFRIAVRLEAPRESTTPIVLAPAKGTWADTVVVELVDAASGKALTRAEAVGKPDKSVATLGTHQDAGGIWRFAPQVTAGLAPGTYLVRARLVIDAGSGWTGESVSSDVAVTLFAATDPAFTDEDRVLARARADFHDGQLQSAAAGLDAWLMTNTASIDVLVLRAHVAEMSGDMPIAIACARVAELQEKGNMPEARPSEAYELSQRLAGKINLDNPKFASTLGSLWAWPPHSKVLAILNLTSR